MVKDSEISQACLIKTRELTITDYYSSFSSTSPTTKDKLRLLSVAWRFSSNYSFTANEKPLTKLICHGSQFFSSVCR